MTRAESIVRRTRRLLKRKGSPAIARRMQMFFKEPVPAYGWRTAALRKLAARVRRGVLRSDDGALLLAVAQKLFSGPTLEEKGLGVALLERSVRQFREAEFRRLEGWLRWVTNWAACDALLVTLVGPMIAADGGYLPRVWRWGRSRNRWHRRAAAVALVPSARQRRHLPAIFRLSSCLLEDRDDMVQKAVGWLLREAGKAQPKPVVAYVMRVRRRAPRLVLRTACETLPAPARRRILA